MNHYAKRTLIVSCTLGLHLNLGRRFARRRFWCNSTTQLNVFGVGVSCRILYSSVGYLYVSGSGSITSVGEERANLSAVVYL